MKRAIPIANMLLAVAAGGACLPATAALSCEQLGQLALSTEQLRDQGFSLEQIARDIDKLAAGGQFSAAEVASMQSAVKDAFLRVRTPNETLLECRARMNR